MNSEKRREGYNSRQICKQALIKLSLAYSFRKMFFISQNLKHVLVTHSFIEVLIFFINSSIGVYFSLHPAHQRNIDCK